MVFVGFCGGLGCFFFFQYGLGISDRTRSEWTRTFCSMV